MATKNSYYFDNFIKMADYSCQAAKLLQTILTDYDYDKLAEQREAMHKLEHGADEIKHKIMNSVIKDFITPIEQEDIVNLANELDDVTDKIEDILIHMYIYNIKDIHPTSLLFADVILRSCNVLKQVFVEFPNFKKSTSISKAIIDVNTMEEEGDKIFIDAMHKLYKKRIDPIDTIVWSELFERFEDCCDTCEHVADVIEIIIMKNI